MQINENFRRIEAFLTILGIMMLAVLDILPNNAFVHGQKTLHNQTLYEVVKQTSGSGENPGVTVGDSPKAMMIEKGRDTATLYVANSGEESNDDSDSVSVITIENNTKKEDILVGDNPRDIASDLSDTVYVANSDSDSVSVITTMPNNTRRVEDILVGDNPIGIAILPLSNVYVANSDSDSVSVITTMPDNTRRVEDILVGDNPRDIASDLSDTVYVANSRSDSVSVITTMPDNTRRVVQNVTVGDNPIAILPLSNTTVYVANSGSRVDSVSADTVSVITTMPDNTRRVVQNVTVGDGPTDIAIDSDSNIVYVANSRSDSVSVISGTNHTKIGEDIPVGDGPTDIAIDSDSRTVYVANSDSDSISVITTMPDNTRRVEDVTVGDGPTDIAIDSDSRTVYVANSDSDSISVIDRTANRVVAGITFQINPFNSGYIACYDVTTPSTYDLTPPSPIGEYIYVYSGTECIAKPKEGFEFVSWEENLEGNATQLISVSGPASLLDSIANFMDPDPIEEPLDSILESLGVQSISKSLGLHPDQPEGATLNITKFGTFAANFRELPPPVPTEFWLQTYFLVGTVIAGLSIPSILGSIRSKLDARKLDYYHKQIASLYEDGKVDENDIEILDRLRSSVIDTYSRGKLNEKHYESLRNEISVLYEKIFRNRIGDSLNGNNNNNNNNSAIKEPRQEQLARIRNEVENAYSEGKINEKHYNLLKQAILDLDSKKADIS